MENIVKVGVSVIIIDKEYRVLVGKRKGSHGAGLLSIPGGHVEFGESYFECCDRETLEEIGVNFHGDYIQVGFSEDFFEHEGVEKHYITLYFALNEHVDSACLEITNMEPNKCEGWEWIPFSELPKDMFCDSYNQICRYLEG